MLTDVSRILRKSHLTPAQRWSLAYFVIKLRFVRFGVNRFFSEKKLTKLRGLGYTFHLTTFGEFYWTFREVFVTEEYYFATKKDAPRIIDCGGHIGLVVLYFKWVYPESNITAFEPLPENYAVLKQNVEGNDLSNVSIHEKAVAASEGTLSFEGDGRAGHLTDSGSDGTITVATTKLSDHVEDEVDFLKIDIEGAEAAVTQEVSESGALAHVSKVVMEYHRQPNNSLGVIVSALEKHGFAVSFNSTLEPLKLSPRDFSHIMLVAVKD